MSTQLQYSSHCLVTEFRGRRAFCGIRIPALHWFVVVFLSPFSKFPEYFRFFALFADHPTVFLVAPLDRLRIILVLQIAVWCVLCTCDRSAACFVCVYVCVCVCVSVSQTGLTAQLRHSVCSSARSVCPYLWVDFGIILYGDTHKITLGELNSSSSSVIANANWQDE